MKYVLWGGFFGAILYYGFLRDSILISNDISTIEKELYTTMQQSCRDYTEAGTARSSCMCSAKIVSDRLILAVKAVPRDLTYEEWAKRATGTVDFNKDRYLRESIPRCR